MRDVPPIHSQLRGRDYIPVLSAPSGQADAIHSPVTDNIRISLVPPLTPRSVPLVKITRSPSQTWPRSSRILHTSRKTGAVCSRSFSYATGYTPRYNEIRQRVCSKSVNAKIGISGLGMLVIVCLQPFVEVREYVNNVLAVSHD